MQTNVAYGERQSKASMFRKLVGVDLLALTGVVVLHYALLAVAICRPMTYGYSYLHLTHSLLDHLLQWDSQWYAAVGQFGYLLPHFVQTGFLVTGNPVPFSPALRASVYFPMVPIVVHMFGVAGAVVVTNLLFIASVCIMYRLFRNVMSPIQARLGVFLYALNPSSIFFSSLYAETYLVFFSLLVVYGLSRRDRQGLVVACIAGFCVAITHETGFLVGIFGLRYLRTREYLSAIVYVSSTIMGWVAYVGYLALRFHSPFVMFSAEKTWQRTWAFPGWNYVRELPLILHHPVIAREVAAVSIMVVLVISHSVVSLGTDRHLKPRSPLTIGSMETGLWMLAQLILCLSTYMPGWPMLSVLRLMSVIWPAYGLLVFRRNIKVFGIWSAMIVAVFAYVGIHGAIRFTHGLFFG